MPAGRTTVRLLTRRQGVGARRTGFAPLLEVAEVFRLDVVSAFEAWDLPHRVRFHFIQPEDQGFLVDYPLELPELALQLPAPRLAEISVRLARHAFDALFEPNPVLADLAARDFFFDWRSLDYRTYLEPIQQACRLAGIENPVWPRYISHDDFDEWRHEINHLIPEEVNLLKDQLLQVQQDWPVHALMTVPLMHGIEHLGPYMAQLMSLHDDGEEEESMNTPPELC